MWLIKGNYKKYWIAIQRSNHLAVAQYVRFLTLERIKSDFCHPPPHFLTYSQVCSFVPKSATDRVSSGLRCVTVGLNLNL